MSLLLGFLFFILGCSKQSNSINWDVCEQSIGEHPCDFTLKDQNGEDWNLYKNYGRPILVDFSAEWCYWCEVAAEDINKLKTEYDFIYVTILLESRTGQPADRALAKKWADKHNSIEPVLYGWTPEFGWDFEGLPAFYMIDRKMIITNRMDGWNLLAIGSFIKETQ
jgi:thiol-disulfide isomerase/thioredoxin